MKALSYAALRLDVPEADPFTVNKSRRSDVALSSVSSSQLLKTKEGGGPWNLSWIASQPEAQVITWTCDRGLKGDRNSPVGLNPSPGPFLPSGAALGQSCQN